MKRSLLLTALFALMLVPLQVCAIKGPSLGALQFWKALEGGTYNFGELAGKVPGIGIAIDKAGIVKPILNEIEVTVPKNAVRLEKTTLIVSLIIKIPAIGQRGTGTLRIAVDLKPEKILEGAGEALIQKYIGKKKDVSVKKAAKKGAKEAVGLQGLSITMSVPAFDPVALFKKAPDPIYKIFNVLMPFKPNPGSQMVLVISNYGHKQKDLPQLLGRTGKDVEIKAGFTVFFKGTTRGPIEKLIGPGKGVIDIEGFFPEQKQGVGAYLRAGLVGQKKLPGDLVLKNISILASITGVGQGEVGLDCELLAKKVPLLEEGVTFKTFVGINMKPEGPSFALEGKAYNIAFKKPKGLRADNLTLGARINPARPPLAMLEMLEVGGKAMLFNKAITIFIKGGAGKEAAAKLEFEGGLFMKDIVDMAFKMAGQTPRPPKIPNIGIEEASYIIATVPTTLDNEPVTQGLSSRMAMRLFGRLIGMTAYMNPEKGEFGGSGFTEPLKFGPLTIGAYADNPGPMITLAVGKEKQKFGVEGMIRVKTPLGPAGFEGLVELAKDGLIVDFTPHLAGVDARIRVETKGSITKKPTGGQIEMWLSGPLLEQGIVKAVDLQEKAIAKGFQVAQKSFQVAQEGLRRAQGGVKNAEGEVARARGKVVNARGKIANARRNLNFAKARFDDVKRAVDACKK